MTCSKCNLWTTGVVLSALFCTGTSFAQTTIYRPPGMGAPVVGSVPPLVGSAPPVFGSAMNGDLSASQYEGDPGAPYSNLFRDLNAQLLGAPKIGAGTANFSFGGIGLSPIIGNPIYRAGRPDSAQMKIGDFYVVLEQARATTYISDNINLTHANRKAGVVGLLGLTVRADYQLNDGLQIGVSGEFVYFPFKNKGGVTGFGLLDPLAAIAADGQPLLQMGMLYPFHLNHWDLVVFDEFTARPRGWLGLNQGFTYEPYDGTGVKDGYDQAGHLRLAVRDDPNTSSDFLLQNQSRTDAFDASAMEYLNTVGAIATSLVPTVSSTTVGYYHNNYWYSGGSTGYRDGFNDTFFAAIQSERENMRFKPFVYFTATKQDYQNGWDKTVGFGVTGPVTDYIFFYGNVGYVFSDNYPQNTLLWRLGVRHDISPTMYQSVDFLRTITQPGDETVEILEYRLGKRWGPYLNSYLYASWSEFQSRSTSSSVVDVYRVGGGTDYDLGRRSSLRFTADVTEVDFADPKQIDYNVLTLRTLFRYQFAETAYLDVFYQFQNYDTKSVNGSYYENLVGINLVKQF